MIKIIAVVVTVRTSNIRGIDNGRSHQVQIGAIITAPITLKILTAGILLFVKHIGSADRDNFRQVSRISHGSVPGIAAGEDDHTSLAVAALCFGPLYCVVDGGIGRGAAPAIAKDIRPLLPGIIDSSGNIFVGGAAIQGENFYR